MPETPAPDSRVLRFGTFEVDLRSAELRKGGVRIALQDKPFHLLVRLLERAGELVTREELQRELWPEDTFVDFDRGLNTTVKRLRDALGDDADTPLFIETRPRHGYRFIAPVIGVEPAVRRAAGTGGPKGSAAASTTSGGRPIRTGALAIVSIALLVIGISAARSRFAGLAPARIARLELSLAPAERLGPPPLLRFSANTAGGSHTAVALTPDGQTVVFVGTRHGVSQLFVRSLDREVAEPLAGTEGGTAPFLSPDGQWVAFWSAHYVRKVRLAGGPVVPICEASNLPPMGASWGSNGRIVFGAPLGPVMEVSADGGQAAPITKLVTGELGHRLPQYLPDGKTILFTVRKRDYTWGDEEIAVQTPGTQAHRTLLSGADARYVASGHLVFLQLGRLMAVRFDASRSAILGPPAAISDGIAQSASESATFLASGAGQFAVSATGTIAYARGGIASRHLVRAIWVDRQGHSTPIPLPPGHYGCPRLSPDGGRVVLQQWELTRATTLVFDLERGSTTVLADGGEDMWPIWSVDGRDVLYQAFEHGEWTIRRRTADGTGAPATLLAGYSITPVSWSPDRSTLAVNLVVPSTGPNYGIFAWRSGERLYPLVDSRAEATHPMFSPGGRYLAYAGYDSGHPEVYVIPVGARGPRVQVSADGGKDLAWSRDGSELFYVAPSATPGAARLMAVPMSARSGLQVGTPRLLFESAVASAMRSSPVSGFDVAADGRFIALIGEPSPPPPAVTSVEVVLNWFEELRRKAG